MRHHPPNEGAQGRRVPGQTQRPRFSGATLILGVRVPKRDHMWKIGEKGESRGIPGTRRLPEASTDATNLCKELFRGMPGQHEDINQQLEDFVGEVAGAGYRVDVPYSAGAI